jgi:hypothetical protein
MKGIVSIYHLPFTFCRSLLFLNYYNYFTEIEELFVRRRGRNLMLSPLDWALIEQWQERGVPLHVVLSSIEKVFDGVDQQPNRKRTIKSISYCKEEIEAQYAEWLDRQVGKSADTAISEAGQKNGFFTRETVSEHLENSIAALRECKNKAFCQTFRSAVKQLEELKTNLTDDYERAEEILTDIENFLDAELKRRTDPAHLNRIKQDVEKHLSAYRNKMDKAVYDKTFDLMLLKKLREEASVPRLSLFSL